MIECHQKLNVSDKVFRYMSFEKFMDILFRKTIYIPRADRFEDRFEGSYSKLIYEISKGITIGSSNQGILQNTTTLLESSFVSCWTLCEFENMALWKLYGGNNSIAIETTVGQLADELKSKKNSHELWSILKKELYKIDYVDYVKDDDELSIEFLKKYRTPLTKKYKAYSYESEIRIIIDHIDQIGAGDDIKEKLGEGIDLNIDVHKLINKVHVSPLADKWFFNLLKIILNDYGMKNLVSWSAMFLTPKEEVFNGQHSK